MTHLTPSAADLLAIFAVPLAAGPVIAVIVGLEVWDARVAARARAKERAGPRPVR